MGIHRSLLLGLFLCLLAAAPADAAITASSISSPGNGSELFFNGDNGSGSVTVSGTVTDTAAHPATTADLVCYAPGTPDNTTVVSGVPISNGTFNVVASLLPIAGLACRLAVVPHSGTHPALRDAAVFDGPAVSVSRQFSHSSAGNLYGYDILTGTLPWSYEFRSAGECPIRASYATEPSTLGSFTLFGLLNGTVGGACLPRSNVVDQDPATGRSTLQIDGLNAYLPGAIATVAPTLPTKTPRPETALASQPGFIPITYSAQFNAAHDTVTITENDAAMICDPPGGYPPTTSTCPSLHDSGVHLTQTTTLLPGGQVARVTQQFTDVDGRAHSLDAQFAQSASAPNTSQSPGFEFPGQTSFATHAEGDSFTQFPAGPSSIIAISNAGGFLPATSNPIGAITYNRPPQSARFITDSGAQTATFLMHYADSLPAGGSVVYDWSFSQASSSATLQTLEQIERDRFGNPTVTIRNPPTHHVTTRSTVRVQGSVTDAVGISTLNVNGQGVIVRPGGIWGVTVNLRPGINTITATATNVAGNTSATSVAVTYNLPPCKVPRLHNKTLSKARHLLANAGCKAGKIKRVHSRKVRKGHVIATRPGAGAKRRNGTKVGLTVSSGKPAKKHATKH